MGLGAKLFGTYSERQIKKLEKIANEIESLAEKYSAMTDEELVVFLDGLSSNCVECNESYGSNEDCPIYKEGHYCRPKDIMDWLRQPVKEG